MLLSALKSKAMPWQLVDAETASSRRGTVIGHKTGLGKTFISILAWQMLDPLPRRVLIVGTNAAIGVWKRELDKWLGLVPIRILTEADWQDATRSPTGIWLTSYYDIRKFVPGTQPRWLRWDLVIVDEAHRFLRNRKNVTYKMLHKCKYKNIWALTATWVNRGPDQLWGLLHLFDRNKFSSFWRFAGHFCILEDSPWSEFDKQIIGAKNLDYLRKILERYLIRRSYEEVAPDLPPIRRQVVDITLPTDLRRSYDELAEDMHTELNGQAIITPNVLSKIVRLRQFCVSPRLLAEKAPLGPALEYILEELEEEPHTVIFSDFVEVLPIIEQEIGRLYPDLKCYTIKGGMDPDKITATATAFNRDVTGVCLCSLQSATSFPLDTVNVAYFVGFNWSPDVNEQAEGRCRRIDSTSRSVLYRYLVTEGTVERDSVAAVLSGKAMTVHSFLAGMYYTSKEKKHV